MTYSDGLRPWAIFQHLPNGEDVCDYRFRTRTDADAFMSILRRGGGEFEVIFDHQPRELKGIDCDRTNDNVLAQLAAKKSIQTSKK